MQTLDSLRPIALQTTRQKWLSNILVIQLEDVLLHCIPAQQTGLLRHRSILRHVYGSRALWDGLQEGAALSVDFKNAFPTMSHGRKALRRVGPLGVYPHAGSGRPPGHILCPRSTDMVHAGDAILAGCTRTVCTLDPVPPPPSPGSVLCYLPTTRPRPRTRCHDVCR